MSREHPTMPGILGYQYENKSTENGLVKIPQISKKDITAFQASQFDKVGLSGPPVGISIMDWSYDSVFLATKCETMPRVVWVWDMSTI